MTFHGRRIGAVLAEELLGVPASRWTSLVPGFALALALGIVGMLTSDIVGKRMLGLANSPISPVMVGIVVGMALRNLVRLPDRTGPGLRFAAAKILRLGIILLGIRLSVFDVARLGALSLPVVVVCILAGLWFTSLLTRMFSLPPRLGLLIGVGTSICGISAIAATGPVIEAEDQEVAYAIAVITVFGIVAMILYPFVCWGLFSGDATSIGLFLGTAVHDTSQVNGAGILYADAYKAPLALDVAVVTKLVRNLFIIVIIPLTAFRHHRSQTAEARAGAKGPGLVRLFPAFVIGFVLMAAFRSAGDAGATQGGAAFGLWSAETWAYLCDLVQTASGWCLVVALSAVGLSTDFRSLRSLSLKPFVVGLGAALTVGAVSFAAITLLAWL